MRKNRKFEFVFKKKVLVDLFRVTQSTVSKQGSHLLDNSGYDGLFATNFFIKLMLYYKNETI